MMQHFAATDGVPVVDTTEVNSTPSTPAPVSTVSPATPSRKVRPMKYIGIPNFRKPRAQNTAATKRQTENRRVPRDYNQRWHEKRTYHVTLTSMSDTSALVDVDLRAESLRGLMLAVVSEMGKLNRRHVARHFSVTLVQRPAEQLLHEESIPVSEGRLIQDTAPRITDHGAVDHELAL
jgi:hypothetical protein